MRLCHAAYKPTFVGLVTQKVSELYSSEQVCLRDSHWKVNLAVEVIKTLSSTIVRASVGRGPIPISAHDTEAHSTHAPLPSKKNGLAVPLSSI